MKDELVESVAALAGLAPDKAEAAVDAVLGYLKENPGALKELQGGGTSSGVTAKLGSARAKVGPVYEDAKVKLTPVAERGKKAAGEAKVKLAPVAAGVGDRMVDVGTKVSEKARAVTKNDASADGAASAAPGNPPVG